MKTWQELALEYAAQNLRPCEVAHKIEKELGVTKMYDKVQKYLKRHFKKEEVVISNSVVRNYDPSYRDAGWNGNETIRFAIMGDTQLGSKYAQLTHLHRFYDLCKDEGITTVYHTEISRMVLKCESDTSMNCIRYLRTRCEMMSC